MNEESWIYRKVISRVEKIIRLTKKAIYFAWYRHHFLIPPRVLIKYIRSFFVALKRGNSTSNLFVNQSAYLKWFEENYRQEIEHQTFSYQPKYSFIIPTYNVSRKLLSECLDSVLSQSYTNFEICIADDHSTSQETLDTLHEYESKYSNIHIVYRQENGMISKASNSAIEMAIGDFIVLVDNDDTIEKEALYYFTEALNQDPEIDFIYSDEDKMDYKGKLMEPHFKPDYSPDTFMGVNYICHLSAIRLSIVKEIGGFRSEYDGSQDYDLFLRVSEKARKIHHVAKILYHWRQSSTSTAGYLGNKSYAYIAGKKAIEDALKRRGIEGDVLDNPRVSTYLVKYHHHSPKVSVIIPLKDQPQVTKRCFDSIIEKTKYDNYEIIAVDNNSEQPETLELLKEYDHKYDFFHSIRLECEFNYSYINNEAVKVSSGQYLLFLNNDTEVIQEDWMDYMVGYASQKHVGCVGIKLLYPDKLVQHAGVVLGYGGVAGHIYVTNSYDDNGLFGRLVMPYDYSAVTAACLMMKRSLFEEIGGFDEKLKVALNDVDLNLKALTRGYYNVCLSNVEMIHYESKSRGYEASSEKHQRFLHEQEYMKEKWKEVLDEDRFFSIYNF